MDNIDNIAKWVYAYFEMYKLYMVENHTHLYNKFYQNIHPPQMIGGGPLIGQSAKNSDEDYKEILEITAKFCDDYPEPFQHPYKSLHL